MTDATGTEETPLLARLRAFALEGREAASGDGVSIGYAELLERVEAAAGGLAAAGIGGGSTVGISIADDLQHLIVALAAVRVGAWQVTLATHDPVRSRQHIAERVGVTQVIAADAADALPGIRSIAWPVSGGAKVTDVAEGGVLLLTSGTTGAANLVPLSSHELLIQAARNSEYASGRLFKPAAIEHNNSKRHRLYCLAMGGTNVCRPAGPFDTIAYCRRHAVTTLDLSLMQAADLAAGSTSGALGDTAVRVSGSAVPYALRRRIEQNLARRLYVRYGSTESGTISIAGPGEHDETGSVGRVAPGLAVEIVDAAGAALPAGEVGHVRMRGAGIAQGYVDGAEQTAKRFRDGWFWPGDMGSLDEGGRLTIGGRADDMINLNGINIFPAEIEQVLEAHPDVAGAAALPLVSSIHGQIPVAAVELRPGGVVTDRELVAYAREHLALRAPRRIVVLDQLPRNSQGKILRREIAAKFSNPGSER
ncbi:MAG: long-chain fatty acid--CoA ligase [Devosia sp.]|uniref:class I adenylate-forming enzyme family protein n=1 Tax=Devosia sp. TaxID=1871048 RepID=UPI001AD2BC28|nr:fatty acid--CoA ligase family protein [Devosia sp.]MBN9316085.1 long-chain fatty acid--CoA ligase [Devosia sp.]